MATTYRLLWIGLLAVALLGWVPSIAAQGPPVAPPHSPHPTPTPQSLAEGKTLFEGTCAGCHGIDGSGANGPDIRHVGKQIGPEGIYTMISTGGAMGSGMPNFSSLGDQKIWLLVNYVSTFDETGGGAVTGDPAKGKEVYEANGCSNCHMIDGKGGDSGPDLSQIGGVRSGGALHDTLIDPGANLPQSDASLQERSPYPSYTMYRVVMKDGKVIEGMRVDEDSFTLQLRDAKGQIRSVNKLDASKIEVVPDKSFMPSYKDKLSDAQLNDLVAYLASLGAAR
ncbi:MAG TPA: c-type cytochrome [Candidatus Acidoferrales bacterium]|jgi:putative heme-binding domain-containing protein|nr:c-type cytochrome [Candidatus Acidoferrales bacterium]